ncbi:unnamed protein product [Ectocarpus sp. 12 AP-2014]
MPRPALFRSDLLRPKAHYIDRFRTLERSTPGVSNTANCPVGLGLFVSNVGPAATRARGLAVGSTPADGRRGRRGVRGLSSCNEGSRIHDTDYARPDGTQL